MFVGFSKQKWRSQDEDFYSSIIKSIGYYLTSEENLERRVKNMFTKFQNVPRTPQCLSAP